MRKLSLLLLAFVAALPAPRAVAEVAPGSVVISEVYPGGGNLQATYANDYVELFNPTRNAVDLTGWAVGYSSKASSTWTSVPLKGSIAAYHYYLVRLGGGDGPGTAALPAPDATGSVNVALAGGKVRLAKPGGVADLLGFGSGVNAYEGHPAPAPSDNRHSLVRVNAGCTDTNDNAKDFRVTTPGPRNKASNGYACGSNPVLAPIGSRTVQANQKLSFQVSATDADKDPLTYSAAPLPAGAVFTPSTRTFTWTPTQAQVGKHQITFKVSDGFRSDSEAVTVSVTPDPYAGRSEITLTVTTQANRLIGTGTVKPAHPGGNVTVRLLRAEGTGWRRVGLVRTTLDANSAYRASFPRPFGGRCVMNATFAGDADHPSSTVEQAFRC